MSKLKDWDNLYTPIKNPVNKEEDSIIFETYGEDFETVKNYNQNHVWTVVDGDNGDLLIIKGLHWVNRVYYIISKESHEGDTEEEYLLCKE